MEYRRIDKDTVQCIVSGSDMAEYGLTMGDIFERSEKAERFFREMIEEAHHEVGYEYKGNNIAMQITPMRDDGMIVTIAEDNGTSFMGLLEHMKRMMDAAGLQVSSSPDAVQNKTQQVSTIANKEQPEDIRVFEFDSMNDLFAFCGENVGAGTRSYLGKADDKYYLVVIKGRMSWKNFNKLSAKAFEFGKVIADISSKLVYLSEHGETIIPEKAISRLAKINRESKK